MEYTTKINANAKRSLTYLKNTTNKTIYSLGPISSDIVHN